MIAESVNGELHSTKEPCFTPERLKRNERIYMFTFLETYSTLLGVAFEFGALAPPASVTCFVSHQEETSSSLPFFGVKLVDSMKLYHQP